MAAHNPIKTICPNCGVSVVRNSEGCESHRARRHPIRRITRGGEIRAYCAVAGCDLLLPRCKGKVSETALTGVGKSRVSKILREEGLNTPKAEPWSGDLDLGTDWRPTLD